MKVAAVAWDAVADASAGRFDGEDVEICGWVAPTERPGYALLCAEPPCCCPPRSPATAIEVFSRLPIRATRAVRIRGRWLALGADPAGWRYQLREARVVGEHAARRIRRRDAIAAIPFLAVLGTRRAQAREMIAGGLTVDMHSHAGAIVGVKNVERGLPFAPVAKSMQAGGMKAVCFSVISDSPVHRVMPDGRIHPYRDPEPGELYHFARLGFERLQDCIRDQQLALVTDATSLRAARDGAPSAIVSAEGADFLEGNIDRIDEAYHRYALRQLQLTHYRVNELGDIQTEEPVHGGLTDTGVAAIKRCNALGIVVDVAHGTYELVKRAAGVTTKPLILSHTALTSEPKPRSRLISPDHARAIAFTGGVIGVWPSGATFRDLNGMAAGMKRLADLVGVDHVGLGTDMLGLVGPSVLDDYRQLPDLAQALLGTGFSADDAAKILGLNYVRVFEATLGPS